MVSCRFVPLSLSDSPLSWPESKENRYLAEFSLSLHCAGEQEASKGEETRAILKCLYSYIGLHGERATIRGENTSEEGIPHLCVTVPWSRMFTFFNSFFWW